MSFTVGVYDLFAYAIPGALYLALGTFISERLGWIDNTTLPKASVGTTLVLVLVSYLIGQILFRPAYKLERQIRKRSGKRRSEVARREFRAEHPALADRPFVDAKISFLRAAVSRDCPENSAEIARFQATAIMLRTAAPAFVAGAIVAIVEAVVGHFPRGLSITCAVVLVAAALSARDGATRLHYWASESTFQSAALIPDIDDLCSGRQATSKSSGSEVRRTRPGDADAPF